MAATVEYGLEWDRDHLLALAAGIRQVYWPISVFLLIPFVLFVLIRKTHMHMECKIAFVVHNIICALFDIYNGYLYQLYTLLPYPVFCCTGALCNEHRSPRVLFTILTCWTVALCVPYLFVMMRMHQKMISNDSPLKLSNKWQALLMLIFSTVLASNVYGFGAWSVESQEKSEILQILSLAWVRNYTSNCLVLGRMYGDIGVFGKEMYLLLFSICVCFSFYVGVTYHAVFWIRNQPKNSLAKSKTYEIQLRFITSLTIQALFTCIMFILPLTFLFISLITPMATVLPVVLLGPLRFTLMVMYSCCTIAHSTVFLFKSTWCIQTFRRLTHRQQPSMKKSCAMPTSSSFTIRLP